MAEGRVEKVFVPVRDGVRLAMTLYLPAGDEPAPCVLEALPYRKDDLTATYAQRAEASADFTVTWPEAAVRARADLVVEAGPTSYDVDLTVATWQDGEPFGSRRWTRSIPRDLG